MKQNIDKINLLFYCLLGLYVISLFTFIGLNHEQWIDEGHFFRAIKLFYEHPNLDSLLHYEELALPLVFWIYALWAKLGVCELWWLRIFSVVIALTTYVTIYFTAKQFTKQLYALIITAFVMFNPYMIGLSFFVYTDMPSIMSIALCLYFLKNENLVGIWLSMVASIWFRQYAIFFTIAVCLWYLVIWIQKKNIKKLYSGIFIGTSTFTVIPLFVFWGGMTPINEVRKVYLQQSLYYNFSGLTSYLATIGFYLLPVILYFIYINRNQFKLNIVIIAFILSSISYIIPSRPSACSIAVNETHIGFINKTLLNKIGQIPTDIVNQLMVFVALLFLFFLYRNISNKLVLLAFISVLSFLLVMPFSYIVWEKYILPLLPILAIAVSQFDLKSGKINI